MQKRHYLCAAILFAFALWGADTLLDISGEELLSRCIVHGRNVSREKQCVTASLTFGGGFFFKELDMDAKDVQQIEVDFSSSKGPGHLSMQFSGSENGKKISRELSRNLHPDGKCHTTIFPVGECGEWSGKINQLGFCFKGNEETICSLKAIRFCSFSNKIPNAKSIEPGVAVYIRDFMPRASYRLSWQGAENPGCLLELLDRELKVLSRIRLSEKEQCFTADALAVVARITLNGRGQGFPQLEQLEWTRHHYTGDYWSSSWMWCQRETGPEYTNVWFEKTFDLDEMPDIAVMASAVDDVSYLYVNGKLVGQGWPYYVAFRYDIRPFLKVGRNIIRLRAYNGSGMGGAICEGYIHTPGGKELLLKSDETWTMAVGGDQMPEKIDQPVVILGPGLTAAPWCGRGGYRYTGRQGKIAILGITPDGFDARVDVPLAKNVERLRFVAKTETGKVYALKLAVTPSQNMWKAGEIVHVRWDKALAPMGEDYSLYVEDDYLVSDGKPVAMVAKSTARPPLSKVEIVDAQTRPKLRINGKIENPFFWLLGCRYFNTPEKGFFEPGNATGANAKIVRLSTYVHQTWLAPDKYDFSKIENQVLATLIEKPDALFIFHGYLYMPEWWLKQHPDSRGTNYDGSRLSPEFDTALSSEEWIHEANQYIVKFVDYVKKQPWADRVVGFCPCESMNGEWFWETNCEPKPTGRSKSDYKAFRNYLKEKYKTEQALQRSWNQPQVTFTTAPMPSFEEMQASKVGRLMDPKTQQNVCDWYEYRGLALARAIISFSKTIKEQTNGAWMTLAYYGYYVMFALQNTRPPQFVGHNGFLEVARSPYVDAVRAPSQYARRRLGDSDGLMHPQDSFLLRNKLVYIEVDNRTYLTSAENQYQYGRYDKPFESLAELARNMGMMLASGTNRYILAFDDEYSDEAIIEALGAQEKAFMSLPPVSGTTPKELAIVGSRESVYYTRFNGKDTIVNGASTYLNRHINEAAIPYRQLVVEDLVEDGLVPSHRFYIMTAPVVLSKDERVKLMERFSREKATVLWLYTAGVTYPGETPNAKACGDFLGMEMLMDETLTAPEMLYGNGKVWKNPTECTPWFYPVKGFDEVLGKNRQGRPMLVRKKIQGATHYFATQLALPMQLIADLATKAGVHRYADHLEEQWWIGNDMLTLYAVSSGMKSVILPPGCVMEAVYGPLKGTFQSNETFPAIAGQTYIFRVRSVPHKGSF